MKTVNLNIRISEELRDEFNKVAESNAQTPSVLVRLWIENYIKQNKLKNEGGIEMNKYNELSIIADWTKEIIRVAFEAIIDFEEIPINEWENIEEDVKRDIYDSISLNVQDSRVSLEFVQQLVEKSFVDVGYAEDGEHYAQYQWQHITNKEVVEMLLKREQEQINTGYVQA